MTVIAFSHSSFAKKKARSNSKQLLVPKRKDIYSDLPVSRCSY